MTIGVGGKNAEQALATLTDMTQDIKPISAAEYQQRIDKAQRLMTQHGIDAIYLNAGTNLYYFTGTRWYASERMVGAILPAQGNLTYIAPHFEVDTLTLYMAVKSDVVAWHEHECPYQLFVNTLANMGIKEGRVGIDESTAFFITNGIEEITNSLSLVSAKAITAGCRMQKSTSEIHLLQRAKDMTMAVHKAVAQILREGISTQEVTQFIDQAHRKVGAKSGSYFCIVLFGEDSSYPHGVKNPKALAKNDVVLIDTGCQLEGYNSDITRTYVFGTANTRQRQVWQHEKDAQLAAFNAAKIGVACGNVDVAARSYLIEQGYGPDYNLPGLPHRTGHGIGLDIHEWPYLVQSDATPLAQGMCFSNEPMLCIPGEFGIRLEDHFFMTDEGPKWFTQPSHSIDDPFGLAVE